MPLAVHRTQPHPRTARIQSAVAGARAAYLLFLAFLAFLAAACALPGRPYRVVPAIEGRLEADPMPPGASLRLRVHHRESPSLHHESRVAVAPDGRFAFDAVELAVAGHEFSKHYLVYLHLETGEADRVIWRADLARTALAGPIRLECEPLRPLRFGQPCRVVDAAAQPWLVAEGARVYEMRCAGCHDDARTSGSERAAPDLREIAARAGGIFDRDAIAEWIEGRSLPPAHGDREMPIWGERLSAEYARHAEGDALIGAALDPLLAWLEHAQRTPRDAEDGAP
ncbi:MAG: cytochrome c [Myxococcales bacterium]|nr:cytochrome c [Myxococcales bacterium]